ncbi:MAG: tetratricopeptide repeat protein, partial [Planctomycetaceae bacterium]
CEAYVNGFFSTYNFPEAFKLLEVWQKDYPRDAQPHYCRGLYETHVGSETEAVKELRRALELAPQRDEIRRFLAEGLIDLEQFDEAEVHIRYLVQRQPGNADLTTALAHCLLEKGDLNEARKVLEAQLKTEPDSPPTRLVMGQLEIREQRPEEALRWLEPIVKARPLEYNARFQYATALQHAGRGSEAVEHLKFVAEAQAALGRARNLMDKAKDDPEDVASRLEIGLTLLKYDSPDDGAHWLRNVLQLDPENAAAHAGLAEYYERQKNVERYEFHRQRAGLAQEKPAPSKSTGAAVGVPEGSVD